MKNKTLFLTATIAAVIGALCSAAVIQLAGDGQHGKSTDLEQIAKRVSALEATLDSVESPADARPVMLPEQTTAVVLNQHESTRDEPFVESDVSNLEELETAYAEPSERDIERQRREQRTRRIERMQPEFRRQQMVDKGFNLDEAARIVELESDMALQQLYDQYEYRKQQQEENPNLARFRYPDKGMRDSLGDEMYERYLIANERPTSVTIGRVMDRSPGANAGLQPGDEIVAYANQRVFNMHELNTLTYQGNEGESVLVEVRRNGTSVQLTIPRGPIGVMTTRF